MSEKYLIAIANDNVVGKLQTSGTDVAFEYDSQWMTTAGAYPVSLSMPLTRNDHPDKIVAPYLWNLLPDNERILGRWAQQFQVSPRNPFALISHVGEDIAGAMQFVRPDRFDALCDRNKGDVQWIGEAEVGERLADLKVDESAWSRSDDKGFFSLSGAQPKLALLHRNGKWGIPSGRTPTTHILKPPGFDFDGHAQNEHFCLTLARSVGLPAAQSEVREFGDQVAIVVTRFDRRLRDGAFERIPMEDTCQALGIHPAKKYQNLGGPSAKDIVRLLRRESSAPLKDIEDFVDAQIFNWLIGGTDAHAKNYSLLIGAGGRARLAPLYDIGSALGYRSLEPKKMKLAMKIGNHYELKAINFWDWRKFEEESAQVPDLLVNRARAYAQVLPDKVMSTKVALQKQGLKHAILDYLCDRIIENVRSCSLRLTANP